MPQAREHKSVVQALAFSKKDSGEPTEQECRLFIAWHSQGATLPTLTPGLLRLVRGFKTMGLALGPVSSPESWAYGFRTGLLFLSDFLGESWDPVKSKMALDLYRRQFGAIPSCYEVTDDA